MGLGLRLLTWFFLLFCVGVIPSVSPPFWIGCGLLLLRLFFWRMMFFFLFILDWRWICWCWWFGCYCCCCFCSCFCFCYRYCSCCWWCFRRYFCWWSCCWCRCLVFWRVGFPPFTWVHLFSLSGWFSGSRSDLLAEVPAVVVAVGLVVFWGHDLAKLPSCLQA